MTRITVISDTHIPQRALDLPPELWQRIEKSELILHAGDITILSVLEKLVQVAPVRAVRGNMDSQDIKYRLPIQDIVEIEGIRIGLAHGWGVPGEVKNLVRSLFQEQDPRVIIYGHSHQPDMIWEDGVLFLNPGSPTDRIFAPYLSYAQIVIDQGRIVQSEIIRLN